MFLLKVAREFGKHLLAVNAEVFLDPNALFCFVTFSYLDENRVSIIIWVLGFTK